MRLSSLNHIGVLSMAQIMLFDKGLLEALGVYGTAIQSPEYQLKKGPTTVTLKQPFFWRYIGSLQKPFVRVLKS